MMQPPYWRRALIDIPAKIFTVWWNAYWTIVGVLIMLMMTSMVIGAVLYAFGIRWGW